MKNSVTLWLPALALCWVPAHAGTISHTDSGTFSAGTPSTAYSGPGETWAFAFQADINPTVSDTGMGGFSFAFSDFSYTLNGSSAAVTPTFIRLFSGTNGGGFAICFDGATFGTCSEGLATYGPQMYTGTPSAPTLVPGSFVQSGFGVIVDSNTYAEPDTTLQASATQVLNGFQGGPTSAPVFVLGASALAELTGTISGLGAEDYYEFYWAGGPFSATASITGASGSASYLFSGGVSGSCNAVSQTLNSGDGFTATLSDPSLAPGYYCIGLDADSAADPNFSLAFNTPVSGVPEPSGFVLLSIGLGMICVIRHAKRGRQHS